jgi:hypothetical protein
MEKEQRNRLQKATQDARSLLEEEFAGQLLQTYDINVAAGRWNEEPGAHLQAKQRLIREKVVAWIEHKGAQIKDRKEALLLALREMAFTDLNRFVALKLMEARELVRPCVSGGLESEGFQEFTAVAQGLLADQEGAYRLYLETIFEDVSRELRALFDPRDPASLLWPKRTALLELLEILNRPELAELWGEDETLGWVYQYFNGDDERKRMRKESAAPRNSRELAVRNQFFTPRYVVEFLTDNTLGRIWYEMRQGQTGLKERCRYLARRPNEIWMQPGEEASAEVVADEALSQEELLRQPVHIPHRPLKDPREIRMLDPACGSMHFGLYAFDLYLAIYEEAWEIAQGSDEQAKQGEAFAAFAAYAADFASKAAFLSEVPRLILLHNIHGIDIDPRATQIARLTLWLRAQKAWQEQQLQAADRPQINRSNVVCAEPMPGEQELLADFVDEQFPETERELVQQLLEVIFDKMRLAGEAGSLLRSKEELQDAISHAQRDWRKLASQQQNLFTPTELEALGQVGSLIDADLVNLTRDFWQDIEERIYASLRDYAEQAQSAIGLQRRLFAEDAAQGFAFIDVCRKQFDVVLMNPPFGEASRPARDYIAKTFQNSKCDMLAAFVESGLKYLAPSGALGAITSRTGFLLSSFQKWREEVILSKYMPTVVADLGQGVLDNAMVETAAYCLEEKHERPSFFYGLTSSRSKADDLSGAIEGSPSLAKTLHAVWPSSLNLIPSSPFAYWVNDQIRNLFKKHQSFEEAGFEGWAGFQSNDDFRWLRTWWEVPQESPRNSDGGAQEYPRWVPHSKGGEFRTYYRDILLVTDWGKDGYLIKTWKKEQLRLGKITANNSQCWNESKYFRAGVTWTNRSQIGLGVTNLPEGTIFGNKGPAAFPGQTVHHPSLLLAILNSTPFRALVALQMAFGRYDTGVICRTPTPSLRQEDAARAMQLVDEIISREMSYRIDEETEHTFLPLACRMPSIAEIGRIRRCHRSEIDRLKSEAQIELDDMLRRAYGMNDHDAMQLANTVFSVEDNAEPVEEEDTEEAVSMFSESQRYLSAICGIAFGRWDIRFATGEQPVLELHSPFGYLPICPPGQLQDAKGFPSLAQDITNLSSPYPLNIPWSGVLVDDPTHPSDLIGCIRQVIETISSAQEGINAIDIEQEACLHLGVEALHDYFRKSSGFFADHLKRYSKSRRQAPIYWHLSAGNGNYSGLALLPPLHARHALSSAR